MAVGTEREEELKRIRELEDKYSSAKEEHRKLFIAVSKGKINEVSKVAQELTDAGVDVIEMGKILTDAMEMIGTKYRVRIVALPELLLSTMCFKKVLAAHAAEKKEAAGVVVLGVVQNDIHDIGKNLVAGMLQVYGYEVHDLGIDVPLEKFVEKAKEVNAHIIGITTLMTSTMPGLQRALYPATSRGAGPGAYELVSCEMYHVPEGEA